MARRHGLTALAVENAKATEDRREISDGRGLFLVIQPKPSGARSWCFRYRRKVDGKPRKLTLGSALTLAEARAKAAEARRLVERGADPAAQKQTNKAAAKQAAAERKADTVANLIAQFMKLHAERKTRTWKITEGLFKKYVLPAWAERSVHDIKKRDVIALIEPIAVDRPISANRTFAHIRKLFSWAVERDVIASSPCLGVKPPAPERQRERVLSDSELIALWNAARDGEQFAPVLRMLILTGQRRGEVAGMRWSEIDEAERTWTLPPSRTKNARAHIVPLSEQAWKIVQSMPRIDGNDFVFATVRNRINYSRAKDYIDAKVQIAESWTFHDIRRSAATNLQKLGVRLEVTEAILNHTSGSRRGVVGIYQRHNWKSEKADALQRWADHVDALVTGKSGKVVKLGARR